MSQAVTETMPIGPVQVYLDNVRLGSPMSQATIRYTKEAVQYGLPDSGVNVGSHKVRETLEVDVVIADLKPHQLRYVFDKSNSKATAGTLDANVYKATSTTVMRFREEVFFSGTAAVILDRAGYLTGTIKVFKSDLSNTPDGYTKSTDFTATNTTGSVARIAAGSIVSGTTVIVEYNHTTTVKLMNVGGGLSDYEGVLVLSHELDNGKVLQMKVHRAKKIGASEIAIQMGAAFGGIPMTYHALADMTKSVGKQLMELAVEE